MSVDSFCKPLIQKLKILGGGKLEYYKSMEGTTKKGEGKFWNFNGVKQKGVEHDFWLKFSGGKNLGGNYDKINPIAFVHNSNYIYFYFQKSNRLWQKHVKQNGIRYNECGNVTEMWLNNVQWRNNIKKKLWKPCSTNS